MASIDEEIKQYTCIIDLTLTTIQSQGFFLLQKLRTVKVQQSYGLIMQIYTNFCDIMFAWYLIV